MIGAPLKGAPVLFVAERTGLEPATPCVTGTYSNQLNYRSTKNRWWVLTGSNRRHSPCKGDALPAELSTPWQARNSNHQCAGGTTCFDRRPLRRAPLSSAAAAAATVAGATGVCWYGIGCSVSAYVRT